MKAAPFAGSMDTSAAASASNIRIQSSPIAEAKQFLWNVLAAIVLPRHNDSNQCCYGDSYQPYRAEKIPRLHLPYHPTLYRGRSLCSGLVSPRLKPLRPGVRGFVVVAVFLMMSMAPTTVPGNVSVSGCPNQSLTAGCIFRIV